MEMEILDMWCWRCASKSNNNNYNNSILLLRLHMRECCTCIHTRVDGYAPRSYSYSYYNDNTQCKMQAYLHEDRHVLQTLQLQLHVHRSQMIGGYPPVLLVHSTTTTTTPAATI
ncbi:hypothetical protein ACJQWK_04009 [Exserohilum turcicum]